MRRGRQKLAQDVLVFGRVELDAPVVQAFLGTFEEGLPGLVGTADGPVVKVEGRHVHGAVVGFSLCPAFRDGLVELRAKSRGPRVALLYSRLLNSLARTRQSCRSSSTSHCARPIRAQLVGLLAVSRVCPSD